MKKNIAIITNAQPESGVGSRAHQIALRMPANTDIAFHAVAIDGGRNAISIDGKDVASVGRWPSILGTKSISWIRLAKKMPQFDVYDLSNQTLSFIANTKKPSIVTVHDIIELRDPQSALASSINKYLLSGIASASHIVAVSEYVKKEIMRYFSIPAEKISVIYNGVSESFKAIPNFKKTLAYQEMAMKLRLPKDAPIVLSIGSDHPRKNLGTTLKVIAKLKEEYPNVLLIKIGEPGLLAGRKDFLHSIDELQLKDNVKMLGKVSQELLLHTYCVADALLMPSYQEGFGMPIIEAMASGCPVICSNATSLPEIAGDAALMHSPEDVAGYVDSIKELYESRGIKEEYVKRGIEQAKKFSWDDAARQTLEIYEKYL